MGPQRSIRVWRLTRNDQRDILTTCGFGGSPRYKRGEMKSLEEKKILIVDDDEGMRKTLAGVLKIKGFNVDTAEDGYDALEMIKNTEFDVILMDIWMPGINGVETFIQVKEICPQIDVIMVTGYSVGDLVDKALSEGAKGIIYKPFEIEDLVEKILALL